MCTNRQILFDFIFIFLVHSLTAQEAFKDNLKINFDYQSGLQVAEYSFINKESQNLLQSFHLSLSKESKGKDVFEQIFKYPEKGIDFHFSSLGNNRLFGHAFGLNYFFLVNLVQTKKFRLTNRLGIGLAYITKKHDFESNPMNVAISSNLNMYFFCRFGLHYKINNQWELNSGLLFDHYSNANTANPNIGLNNLFASIGVTKRISKETELLEQKHLPIKHSFDLELVQSIGSKHSQAILSRYFVTSSTSVQSSYKWFTGFHVGAGLDLFYDSSVKYVFDHANRNFRNLDAFQLGFHISQTVAYKKFRFTLQEGVYFGLTNKLNHKSIYNRGILAYNINKMLSVRIAMKSHLHILDYPEIGFGFKLL